MSAFLETTKMDKLINRSDRWCLHDTAGQTEVSQNLRRSGQETGRPRNNGSKSPLNTRGAQRRSTSTNECKR